ncbi:MAG: AmmeMemoRadiSam system radical SAM enzyme [Candidatus Aminicenantes bacterium]|jgi:pyruvate formate lyase activating enzyme
MIKEAMLYHSLEGQRLVCNLCSHRCEIVPDKFGICGVRQNREGTLFTHVYGDVIAAHVDPIEKKPLYHYLPGSTAFSVATIGCNFKCPFCQNWQISQQSKRQGDAGFSEFFTPEDVVRAAKNQGCQSISYTYTEPTIFFEFAYDTAKLAKKEGLGNSFVTNGYMTAEALKTINPYLDACNVDLKSFREQFYQEMCRAHLEPVCASISLMKALGIWVEVTTLVVPGQNDSDEELAEIAHFIADVDPDIPWHISRFHPDYQFTNASATPIETLRKAYSLGKKAGLRYIYIGNVLGEAEDTHCPNCGTSLIQRAGFVITKSKIAGEKCSSCGHPIAGVF